jgi:hypothetical protein
MQYLIKIPPGLKPWEADNWRAVAEALKSVTSTDSKISSPTTGLGAGGSKVKISIGDAIGDYLQKKLIAGTGVTLTKSNTGGMGGEILTAAIGAHADLTDMPDTAGDNTDHDIRYATHVGVSAPAITFEGKRWYDTDAPDDFSIYDNVITHLGEVVTNNGRVVHL